MRCQVLDNALTVLSKAFHGQGKGYDVALVKMMLVQGEDVNAALPVSEKAVSPEILKHPIRGADDETVQYRNFASSW